MVRSYLSSLVTCMLCPALQRHCSKSLYSNLLFLFKGLHQFCHDSMCHFGSCLFRMCHFGSCLFCMCHFGSCLFHMDTISICVCSAQHFQTITTRIKTQIVVDMLGMVSWSSLSMLWLPSNQISLTTSLLLEQ